MSCRCHATSGSPRGRRSWSGSWIRPQPRWDVSCDGSGSATSIWASRCGCGWHWRRPLSLGSSSRRLGVPSASVGRGSRRRWIVLGGVVVLIVIVVVLRGTATGDSPEHSSASDAGNGTSALRLYAESLGHATRAVEGDYTLPSTPALLFVFRPTEGFSNAESQQLDTWLRAGNVAVYATEERDPQLDSQS